jgi:DnaK suppressor protein
VPVEPENVRLRLIEDEHSTRQRRDSLGRDFSDVVAATSDVATDDEHDPEGSTIGYERSRVAALVAQADAHLDDIRRALDRLDAGTYGVCERCSGDISDARLEARPVSRTCIACASSAG